MAQRYAPRTSLTKLADPLSIRRARRQSRRRSHARIDASLAVTPALGSASPARSTPGAEFVPADRAVLPGSSFVAFAQQSAVAVSAPSRPTRKAEDRLLVRYSLRMAMHVTTLSPEMVIDTRSLATPNAAPILFDGV